MAEGDTTGRGGTPTPDGHPTGERDAADRERRSDAGKKRGTGGEESPEVFARPSWDHAKDFPEPLAEGRTSTAVAIATGHAQAGSAICRVKIGFGIRSVGIAITSSVNTAMPTPIPTRRTASSVPRRSGTAPTGSGRG